MTKKQEDTFGLFEYFTLNLMTTICHISYVVLILGTTIMGVRYILNIYFSVGYITNLQLLTILIVTFFLYKIMRSYDNKAYDIFKIEVKGKEYEEIGMVLKFISIVLWTIAIIAFGVSFF